MTAQTACKARVRTKLNPTPRCPLRCCRIKTKKKNNSKKRTKDNNETHYNYYSCKPPPSLRRDKFSPVCLAHPLRCCKKKKRKDKHDRQRTAKIKQPLLFTPPIRGLRAFRIVPSQRCLLLALCACRPWRRTRCRCSDFRCHYQPRCRKCRAAARHILPGSRGHEGRAALCLVERTVHLPHMAWYAPA